MAYVKKYWLSGISLESTILALRKKQHGQDFFGICEQPQNKFTCKTCLSQNKILVCMLINFSLILFLFTLP